MAPKSSLEPQVSKSLIRREKTSLTAGYASRHCQRHVQNRPRRSVRHSSPLKLVIFRHPWPACDTYSCLRCWKLNFLRYVCIQVRAFRHLIRTSTEFWWNLLLLSIQTPRILWHFRTGIDPMLASSILWNTGSRALFSFDSAHLIFWYPFSTDTRTRRILETNSGLDSLCRA